VNFIKDFFREKSDASFKKELKSIMGFYPKNLSLYKTALTHRSLNENVAKNNERLEYLGDAMLGALVADYLFKRYPYQGEGFLTEMRSKMVNRKQLNEIAVKIGLKKITKFNNLDRSLKTSHIFGNTLEALVGAIFIDIGYKKTYRWVLNYIILPHMFVDELESVEINHKNKLYGWASKNRKILEFVTIDERRENGRRVFTVAAVVDGRKISQAWGFTKKDASQIAAGTAIAVLGLNNISVSADSE
jgi:ribonuclease-3